jgi:hypothetical protein
MKIEENANLSTSASMQDGTGKNALLPKINSGQSRLSSIFGLIL